MQIRIIFIDFRENIHARKFLSFFQSIAHCELVFLENISGKELDELKKNIEEFDILVYANFFQLNGIGLEDKIKKVCISWTSDIISAQIDDGLLSKDLFDLLIVDSSFSERLWIKAGFCQSKIFKIPFGININSTSLPNVLDRKNLISTRSWEKNYNQETILSAIKLINNEAYYQPVHFMGTGSMLAPLRSKFMKLHDNGNVVYFGNIDNFELQKILTRYKLYISASSSDGTSVSMLEAMAAGTPVLVADIEPNREWITHGENGFLFETFSPDDLAIKLTEILQDKFDLATIAGSAMQIVRSRADWFRNSQALISALRSI